MRPDALAPCAAGAPGSLAARLELVEDLGDRVDLRFVVGDTAVVARLGGGAAPAPGPAGLRLDLARAHLFEPGSHGARLSA
ncbi:MAG: hypothetical protein H6828_14375 [Planctomycetes bacterium]|nr:hypothetical protein [Planctomycetota bacterium]